MTSDIIKIRALLKYMTQHRAHWYTFCHPLIETPRAATPTSTDGYLIRTSPSLANEYRSVRDFLADFLKILESEKGC